MGRSPPRRSRSLSFSASAQKTTPGHDAAEAYSAPANEWIEAPAETAAAGQENDGWLYAWDECAECGYWHHPDTDEIVWVEHHAEGSVDAEGSGFADGLAHAVESAYAAEEPAQPAVEHTAAPTSEAAAQAAQNAQYTAQQQQQHAAHAHEHDYAHELHHAAAQSKQFVAYTAEEEAAYYASSAATEQQHWSAAYTSAPAPAGDAGEAYTYDAEGYAVESGTAGAYTSSAHRLEQQWEAAKGSAAPAATATFTHPTAAARLRAAAAQQPACPSTADRKASCFTTVRGGAGRAARRAPKTRPRPNLHLAAAPQPVSPGLPVYNGADADSSDSGTTAESPGAEREEQEHWMDMDDTPNSRA